MDQILDRLWLGTYDDAAVFAACADLADNGLAVLTLCERTPALAREVFHVYAPIADEVALPRSTWTELAHTLTHLLVRRHTVLVHCRLGVSRAPTLVALYLARCGHSRDPQAALAYLVSRRGCVSPHEATWQSMLAAWEGLA